MAGPGIAEQLDIGVALDAGRHRVDRWALPGRRHLAHSDAGVWGRVAAVVLRRPLLTVERIRVCKRDGELLARPDALPDVDEQGLPLWQKLMVYTSESARHDGMPIHRALVRRLRDAAAPLARRRSDWQWT